MLEQFDCVSVTERVEEKEDEEETFSVCSPRPSLAFPRSFPGRRSTPPHSIPAHPLNLPACRRSPRFGRRLDSVGPVALSRGQAVQGVQREEDVCLALEGARPVPQQLATLQVGRDVLHTDCLRGGGEGEGQRGKCPFIIYREADSNMFTNLLLHDNNSKLTNIIQ